MTSHALGGLTAGRGCRYSGQPADAAAYAAVAAGGRHGRHSESTTSSLEEQSCQISSRFDLKRRVFLKRSPHQQLRRTR